MLRLVKGGFDASAQVSETPCPVSGVKAGFRPHPPPVGRDEKRGRAPYGRAPMKRLLLDAMIHDFLIEDPRRMSALTELLERGAV